MTEYNNYVDAINKIFESIEIMKTKWTNQDNLNYLEQIEEYKARIIELSKLVETKHNVEQPASDMEALGE